MSSNTSPFIRFCGLLGKILSLFSDLEPFFYLASMLAKKLLALLNKLWIFSNKPKNLIKELALEVM